LRFLAFSLPSILCAALLPLAPSRSQTHELVVSPDWLRDHLAAENIVLLHVSSMQREYRRAHIPGARYLWASSLYPSNPDGSIELPTPDEAAEVFSLLGVTPSSRVVLYGVADNVTPVTRAFVALEYFLPEVRVSILNGGLDAWTKAGFQVASGDPAQVARSPVAVTTTPGLIVDGDWIRARMQDTTIAVIDSRSRSYYEGKGGGRPRPGRIPGALSVQFTDVVDSAGAFKSPDSLRAIFRSAGVRPGQSVVTYCHVGLQASLVHVAARIAGFRSRLYDLSFEEWSWREDLPVEKD
jgi:thiosulfate/3-mercaptopyruvate sulfurtransferase